MRGFDPDGNNSRGAGTPDLPIGIIHLAARLKTGVWPVLDQAGRTHMKSLAHPVLPM
jgi:hypothetical protein